MRKWLAMLAVLVIGLCGAWSQVPRDGSPQQQDAKEQQKTANPPKPVVAVESHHATNDQDQTRKESSGYPWGELLAPANVPNWFLVIVGAVTGWFVYKTLRAIKKQADIMETGAKEARESGAEATRIALATAKAAQKSAEATAAQIQLMKAHERARLSVEAEEIRILRQSNSKGKQICELRVALQVRNIGRARAYIGNSAVRFLAYPFDVNPPALEEELAFSLAIPVEFIDPADGSIRVLCKLEERPADLGVLVDEVQKLESTMYFYGFIEYETMGTRWHHPFGYFWTPTSQSVFEEGFWDTHSGLNKTEYEASEKAN